MVNFGLQHWFLNKTCPETHAASLDLIQLKWIYLKNKLLLNRSGKIALSLPLSLLADLKYFTSWCTITRCDILYMTGLDQLKLE